MTATKAEQVAPRYSISEPIGKSVRRIFTARSPPYASFFCDARSLARRTKSVQRTLKSAMSAKLIRTGFPFENGSLAPYVRQYLIRAAGTPRIAAAWSSVTIPFRHAM